LGVNRKPEMGNALSKIPALLGVWLPGARHFSCNCTFQNFEFWKDG